MTALPTIPLREPMDGVLTDTVLPLAKLLPQTSLPFKTQSTVHLLLLYSEIKIEAPNFTGTRCVFASIEDPLDSPPCMIYLFIQQI